MTPVALILLAVLAAGPSQQVVFPAWCVRVLDGDTVDVLIPAGPLLIPARIRLAEIDAPELRRLPDRIPAARAKWIMERLVLGRPVWIMARLTRTGRLARERYDRVLAHVLTPDGRDAGQVLLDLGLAKKYER